MKNFFQSIATTLVVSILGLQSFAFVGTSQFVSTVHDQSKNTAVESPEGSPTYLTYENLNRVSTEGNVIWFVLDRFDITYYEDYAKKECPEIFYNLDGFTYFNDMLSLYPRTFPSVAYMLTGVEHDFYDRRTDYFWDAYSTSPFLNTLHQNGYDINIYTDSYYAYDDARAMQKYICNSSDASINLSFSERLSGTLRSVLLRAHPNAKEDPFINKLFPAIQEDSSYEKVYPKYSSEDPKDIYSFLQANPLKTYRGKKNFSFIHIAGCHMPNQYDENFNEATGDDWWDPVVSMKQSFKIINRYLDQLKELGLYEDATIIITGDHGWHGGSDTEYDPFRRPHVTAFFIKESGKSSGELQLNTAPVTQGDILPTILASEGIKASHDFGRTLFEIGENETRVRKYSFQSWQSPDGVRNDELVIFEVIGSARDLKNWHIVSKEYLGGSFYQ